MTSPEKENQIGEIQKEKIGDSPHEHQRSTATFQIEFSGGVQGTVQQDNTAQSGQIGRVDMMKCLLPFEIFHPHAIKLPHEIYHPHAIDLPRTDEASEDITPNSPAMPSRKLRRIGSPSDTLSTDATSQGRVTRRSARIESQGVGDSTPLGQSGSRTHNQYGKRPLYMTRRKDEYKWFDTSDEDDE